MSELSERWQKLKSDIGSFTGELNNLAIRYEPLADVEQKAYKRGYEKGYQEAFAKSKADICKCCEHKDLAEKACKYAYFLEMLDGLSAYKVECVGNIMDCMKKGNR